MLPAARRLRSERDFHRLYQRSRPRHGRFFTIRATVTSGTETRTGIVVSKKVCPHAVDRNRLKRRVRNIVATLPHPKPALDVAIIANAHAPKQSFDAIRTDLVAMWPHSTHAPSPHRSH